MVYSTVTSTDDENLAKSAVFESENANYLPNEGLRFSPQNNSNDSANFSNDTNNESAWINSDSSSSSDSASSDSGSSSSSD